MRSVRSRDTGPELLFRKALWKKGIRYRLCARDMPGKPDIVVPSLRLAIFIDGDFWHGGQWSRRNLSSLEDQFTQTGSRDYWIGKIRRNMDRDCGSTSILLSQGWRVLRFWESEIKKNLENCLATVCEMDKKPAEPTSFSLAPQKNFAEFFSGIGLVRMALERHGWKVAYANDIDPDKYKMYSQRFQDKPELVDLQDIHKISADRVPNVTLATASFPCNDLSVAGSRNGLNGKKSSSFWGFIRLLGEMNSRRPPIVLIENVPGFLNSNNGKDFRDAMMALNNLGYSVDPFLVDAAWFVPQSRLRLFVIGQISDKLLETTDKLTVRALESRFRPRKLVDFINNNPEITWNIREMPQITSTGLTLTDIIHDPPHESPEWWSGKRAAYLLSQMSPRHRKVAESMMSGSGWSYGTVFRRIRNGKSMAELRTDGIAGCLRTPRGGSAKQIVVKAGKGSFFARLLTPLECARLMGAGDNNLPSSASQAFFGFGDAVCVPVIEWIAIHRLNPLVAELIRGKPLYPIESTLPEKAKCDPPGDIL